MAELILTDDDKAALSWLDLSDENLGKVCRKALLDMPAFCCNDNANKQMIFFNAGLLLCKVAAESKAEKLEFTGHGVRVGGVNAGDWLVTVRRVGKPKGSPT